MAQRADHRAVSGVCDHGGGLRQYLRVRDRCAHYDVGGWLEGRGVERRPERHQPAYTEPAQRLDHLVEHWRLILLCGAETDHHQRVGVIRPPRRLPRLRPDWLVELWADVVY